MSVLSPGSQSPSGYRLSEAEPLLLASGSPRRREILASLGVPTLVTAVDVDESVSGGESPESYLVRIVDAKLEAASAPFDSSQLVTCDMTSTSGAGTGSMF